MPDARRWILPLLLVVAQCDDASSPTPLSTPTPDPPALQLTIDWTALDQIQAQLAAPGRTITHLGVRIVGTDGATFVQAFARADGARQLRLVNPFTEHGTIYTAAGSSTTTQAVAVQFGARSFTVAAEGTTGFTLTDLNWTAAEWQVRTDVRAAYESGAMEVSPGATGFSLPIVVRDPFQVGATPVYEGLWIALTGSGGHGANTDGWREFNVTAANPAPGTVNESRHTFGPYLRGEAFNLPPARYAVLPSGEFRVQWR